MEPKTMVSVQRGKSVEERVKNVLEDLGGIQELVPPGKRVLVKPNLVMEVPHSSGATTNPRVLDALLKELQRTSPREIIVGEGAAAVSSTEKAFQVTGIDRMAREHGARVVDFKKDRYDKVEVPRGKELKQVQVARTVRRADIIINVPILKVHAQTRVTVSLKNLKGCISDNEKKRFHRMDLEQCIADLNTIIPVDLVLVDATVCSFAWEGGGSPVPMDTVLAGTNPVAVDTVAAPLLGYHPGEIEHLQRAGEHGLGPAERKEVQVLHEEELQQIELPEEALEKPSYEVPGLQVVEKGTCTPCLAGHLAALRRLSKEKAPLPATLYLGQRLEEEDLQRGEPGQGKLLGIGNCGARLVGKDRAVTGCPPEGWRIYSWLKEHTH